MMASTKAKMQHGLDQFASVCTNFGLAISTKKTEVIHQPIHGTPYTEPIITVNGKRLNNVDRFTYLGLSQAVRIDDEVNTGNARARATFWEARLRCLGTQQNYSVDKADHPSITLVSMRNLDRPVGMQGS